MRSSEPDLHFRGIIAMIDKYSKHQNFFLMAEVLKNRFEKPMY